MFVFVLVYEMNYKPERCGSFGVIEPDVSLLSAVETVLQYYMVEQDYLEWKESLK
jgi:NADH:ubiquinone oxidoreductase subunit 3 (subunit A)